MLRTYLVWVQVTVRRKDYIADLNKKIISRQTNIPLCLFRKTEQFQDLQW
jgi:hypothetical protein